MMTKIYKIHFYDIERFISVRMDVWANKTRLAPPCSTKVYVYQASKKSLKILKE